MCVVSMVGDYYGKRWDQDENIQRLLKKPDAISRAEFESLKKDVQEMKELLKKAVDYDKITAQPDCQNEEKIALLRKVAELVGINIDEVFK